MKKSFGDKPYLFPMPTYMIGTYNDDDSVDAMMMAWGGICDNNMVALNLEKTHKTVTNLYKRKAFTLAIPSIDTLEASDYLGTISGNNEPNKFAISGLSSSKSKNVDAPIINEYPVTLECIVEKFEEEPYGLRILGKIVNVLADESVLDEKGQIDFKKVNTFVFDQINYNYYAVGEKVGKAWHSGNKFIKKK